MKLTLFVILLLSLFVTCQYSHVNSLLLKAESFMVDMPDSALLILEQIKEPDKLSENQKIRYYSLMAEAVNESKVFLISDSLENITIDYFKHKDNLRQRATSLYYEGHINEDISSLEKMMQNYLKVKRNAMKAGDRKLYALILNRLASLHKAQYLYEKALSGYIEAGRIFMDMNDSVNLVLTFQHTGQLYVEMKSSDSALYYYHKALDYAIPLRLPKMKAVVLAGLSNAYLKMGKYNEADEYVKTSLQLSSDSTFTNAQYLLLGEILLHKEMYDSAFVNLQKSFESEDLYAKEASCLLLYSLFRKKENVEKAFYYNDLYLQYRDSIESLLFSESVIEIEAKYNHEWLANRNNQILVEKANATKMTYQVLCCAIIFIVVLIYLYRRLLQKKEHKLKAACLLIDKYRMEREDNLALISCNLHDLADLKILISQKEGELSRNKELLDQTNQFASNFEFLHKENIDLLREIETLSTLNEDKLVENTLLITKNEILTDKVNELSLSKDDLLKEASTSINNILRKRENMFLKIISESKPVLQKVMCASAKDRCSMSERDWEDLCDVIDELYSDFTIRLSKEYPFLERRDIYFCCLIKLNLRTSVIANLFHIAPNTISKYKIQIRKKIASTTDESIDNLLFIY